MIEQVRVLHIVSALNTGGVEMMLKNYYEHLDNNRIHFDFIVHDMEKGEMEEFFLRQGSNIFHVIPKKESIMKNFEEINEIIKKNHYDIVHCHQNFYSFPGLISAKIHGVNRRIIHSHGCQPTNNILKKIYFKLLRKICILFATDYFACGEAAANWLYGTNFKKKIYIMKNAIDLDKFKFDQNLREEYRKKLNLKDKLVLIHVGRFSEEKNHLFLLNLIEKLDNNVKLFLVGDGPLQNVIEKEIKKRNLKDKVIMLGKRKDIPELLCMSDIFLLPSKNEGFPVSVIEAQATKINCILSNNVSKKVMVSKLVEFADINKLEQWKEKINKIEINKNRKNLKVNINEYDIKLQAKKYLKYMEEK